MSLRIFFFSEASGDRLWCLTITLSVDSMAADSRATSRTNRRAKVAWKRQNGECVEAAEGESGATGSRSKQDMKGALGREVSGTTRVCAWAERLRRRAAIEKDRWFFVKLTKVAAWF